ncbi:MAG TPA: BrnA antitoxin family protein, partial [Paracoccaceae bacterium]|nr:BrnA antitoxin family protein [Paracoccaceae bacterium]
DEMSGKAITRLSAAEAGSREDETDQERLKALTDEEIEAAIAGDPEADPELDWTRAELVEPVLKKPVSIRLDPDVLEFFRAQGKGYQTRINAVLRAYMEAKRG